ncbi:MAG: glycosyltransferase family A protein [Alphaproteobacteria bacterium]|nr:glycosyltransferase family A protein [Alphaproteobacteria bacterium]
MGGSDAAHAGEEPDNPLVTIITRTYGQRGALLAGAARSVIAQSYRPIEWLVVEDGDGEADKVIRALDLPPGLTCRVIHNPKRGRAAAANAGLKNASGEFLCFLDDDDELFSHHVSTLMGLFDKHPIAAAAYSASLESTDRQALGQAPGWGSEKVFLVPLASTSEFLERNVVPIHAILFRQEYVAHKRMVESLDALEDWLFWIELLLETKVVWTPEITSRYFVPSDQAKLAQRREEHLAMEQNYIMQRDSFLTERGVWRLSQVVNDGRDLLKAAVSVAKVHEITEVNVRNT